MAVSGFLIKTPEHTQPADALDEMLSLTGNRLMLAYGGVRHASDTEEDYEKLRRWLLGTTDRHLTMIYGIWGRYKKVDPSYIGESIFHRGSLHRFEPFEDEIQTMKATLKRIFDFSKLPAEVVDRVHVYGIANFHPKVMYLSQQGPAVGQSAQPVALQFGSSNFTGAARRKGNAFQYEMDLFLRWDVPEHRGLITNFIKQWEALHAATRKYDADEFNMDIFFDTFEQALIENNEDQARRYLEGWFDE